MRPFLLICCFVLFRNVLFGQAFIEFDQPFIDNTMSFIIGHYDTALIKKNRVEKIQQSNQTFYFDSCGRITKYVLIRNDSSAQIILYKYSAEGALVETELSSPEYKSPIIDKFYKTYEHGLLVKDSFGFSTNCNFYEYYQQGSLRRKFMFRSNHILMRAFWFGIDSLGQITRIIERHYQNANDSIGLLVSNRTIFYNEKGQIIKEVEAVEWPESKIKNLFCPNTGSRTFKYDEYGKLIETERTKGLSQKITYLDNGLIAEIDCKGKICDGTLTNSVWKYIYTYRK